MPRKLKNVPVLKGFFSTTTYAATPYLGISKPPALRVVCVAEHYYGKRYKLGNFCTVNSVNCIDLWI